MEFLTDNIAYVRTALLTAAVLLFFLSMYFFAAHAIVDRYKLVRERLTGKISEAMSRMDKSRVFSYEYIQLRLDARGVTYYSKGRITPLVYLSGRIFCAVGGFAAGMMFDPMFAAAFATAAYFYPDIHARMRNNRDNEKMLCSIMDVYDVVFLQTNAGEYITRTLIDAYRVASHPRLKAALIALTGDILATNDILLSIELFGRKFDNENIDNLVITIKQITQNGASEAMMSDIRRYLGTLMESYNRYEQERTRRMGDICLFAIFFCLMGVLVYAGVKGLLDSAKLFTPG